MVLPRTLLFRQYVAPSLMMLIVGMAWVGVADAQPVTTVAGGASIAYGPEALHRPIGLALQGDNLFVAVSGTHNIRKIIRSTGQVTTVAGVGSESKRRSNVLYNPSEESKWYHVDQ